VFASQEDIAELGVERQEAQMQQEAGKKKLWCEVIVWPRARKNFARLRRGGRDVLNHLVLKMISHSSHRADVSLYVGECVTRLCHCWKTPHALC
jgi:hypothetical protein